MVRLQVRNPSKSFQEWVIDGRIEKRGFVSLFVSVLLTRVKGTRLGKNWCGELTS
jgi:hypothetical protein